MIDVLYKLTSLPIFGILITLLMYEVGVFCNRKLKSPIVNPLLIADVLIIIFIMIFKIPYENYEVGGDVIEIFLSPATAVLAVKMYEQLELLKKEWLPIIIASAVGAFASVVCVTFLCRLLFLSPEITASLFPKSVTTAIALPLSAQLGGIESITVIAISITGIMGAVMAPFFIKFLRIRSSVVAGVAIGTTSHAMGTTKAIEIGDVEGAVSGISIGIAGLATVFYAMLQGI